MLVGLLIALAVVVVGCALSVANWPRTVPIQSTTSPPQIATTEARPIDTPAPLTSTAEPTVEATVEPAVEATAEASMTTPLETPSPDPEQIATARPALDQTATPEPSPAATPVAEPQVATSRPAVKLPRATLPPTAATQVKDTPEPVPKRATFFASPGEYTIDHFITSGSEALIYITLHPDRDAYFDGSDFELRLPPAAGSGLINGRSEGAWRLFAGESGQRIVQFDIPPGTALAGSTLRWSYHDRP